MADEQALILRAVAFRQFHVQAVYARVKLVAVAGKQRFLRAVFTVGLLTGNAQLFFQVSFKIPEERNAFRSAPAMDFKIIPHRVGRKHHRCYAFGNNLAVGLSYNMKSRAGLAEFRAREFSGAFAFTVYRVGAFQIKVNPVHYSVAETRGFRRFNAPRGILQSFWHFKTDGDILSVVYRERNRKLNRGPG